MNYLNVEILHCYRETDDELWMTQRSGDSSDLRRSLLRNIVGYIHISMYIYIYVHIHVYIDIDKMIYVYIRINIYIYMYHYISVCVEKYSQSGD